MIGVDNVANKKGTHPRQGVSKIGTLSNDRVCFELEKRKIIKGKSFSKARVGRSGIAVVQQTLVSDGVR